MLYAYLACAWVEAQAAGCRHAGRQHLALVTLSEYYAVKHLLLALCLLPLRLWAQTWPVDPVSGKITYAEEVPVKDAPRTDLYQRAHTWWKATHPKAAAWQLADFSNGVLIGRNNTVLQVACGKSTQTWLLWYTLKIEMEDDRYWYRLYDLQLQQKAASRAAAANTAQPGKQALEPLVLRKAAAAQRRGKSIPPALPEKTQQALLALIQSLKASML